MTNTLEALAVALVLTMPAACPASVHAQYVPFEPSGPTQPLDGVEPAHREAARAELADVDLQSALATAGYVTSIAVHLGGLGLLVLALPTRSCDFGAFGGGSTSCTSSSGSELIQGLAGAAALLGVAGIAFSIWLDVDSGARRRDWRARHAISDLAFSAVPTNGGLALSLAGRF